MPRLYILRHSCAALLTLCALAATAAEPAVPGVALHADSDRVAVGDRLALTLVYRWHADAAPVQDPDPSAALSATTVTAIDGPVRRTAGGVVRERWRITVLLERSGVWTAPRFALRLADGVVRSEELLIEVGADAAPADLPPPSPLWKRSAVPATPAAPRWPWWVGGGGVLALGAWWWWRRRRRPAPTPYQRFQAALPQVLAVGDAAEAGARLAGCLRAYCGGRWGFDGAAATARELLAHLDGHLDTAALARLRMLMQQLDDLRFSPEGLALATVRDLHGQARDWVDAAEHAAARAERAEAAA